MRTNVDALVFLFFIILKMNAMIQNNGTQGKANTQTEFFDLQNLKTGKSV